MFRLYKVQNIQTCGNFPHSSWCRAKLHSPAFKKVACCLHLTCRCVLLASAKLKINGPIFENQEILQEVWVSGKSAYLHTGSAAMTVAFISWAWQTCWLIAPLVSIVQVPGSVALWLICFLVWFCFQIITEISELLSNEENSCGETYWYKGLICLYVW